MGRWWWLLLAMVCAATVLPAQVVRGNVTERNSGLPLAGVLIELRVGDANGARVATALTSTEGRYAVQASRADRYVVLAKRIGVKRYVSPPFDLGPGESAVRDLQLDPIAYALPEVVVTGFATCDDRSGDPARLAALWEEVRTALVATQVSLRDQLYRAQVTRFVREIDPRSRRVVGETRSDVSGVMTRPFVSVDPESLSAHGYRVSRPDSGTMYYGLDADVLLSDAFHRDHCFHAQRGGRDRRGQVGLGFRPLESRTVPDVIGTIWIDERSFELRSVEFGYSRAAGGIDSSGVGGEVLFSRLPGGAWIIRRWVIRLPMTARPTAPVTTLVTPAPWVLVRPTTLRWREEGGEVAAEERQEPARR